MDYFIKDPLVPLSVILHVSRTLHYSLKNQDQLDHPFLFRVSTLYCLPGQQTENSAALYFVVGGSKLMVTLSWNTAL